MAVHKRATSLRPANLPGKKFPSTPNIGNPMCRSTISSKLGQDSLSKRRLQGHLKDFSKHPACKARTNLIWRQALPPGPQFNRYMGKLIARATQQLRENHEEKAFKHRVGNCGPSFSG